MHPNDKIVRTSLNAVIPIKSNPELDKIKSLSHKDIKESNPPIPLNILYPWLPEQGIALIYAAAGVGKTLFSLNIAYCIASGGNFLTYKVPKPKKVLYVDGEMQYARIHARYMDIIKQQGDLDKLTENNFFLLNQDKISPFRLPKIDTIEGQLFYNKIIDENEIEVVFFDNFACLSTFDENVAEEWNFVQDWFLNLRAKGKSVIAVHHAGKDKKGYRGTSRMIDCIDTAISLQDISEEKLENDAVNCKRFKVEYKKSRTFGGKEALPFEISLDISGWDSKSLENSTTDRIIDMLKLKMTHKDIGLELGFTRSYISRLVRKAIKNGLIQID